MTTATAPRGYATEDEFPAREIPDVPLWSENYCYAAYDGTADVGVWTHLGRAAFDPTLWRELAFIYLPGGRMLLSKGWGRHSSERGPGAAALEFICKEPWNEWRMRFDGAAIPADRKRLEGSLLTDDVHVAAGIDLRWEGFSPIWEMGEEMRKQTWGHLHYEQLCKVTGTVRDGDTEIALDGYGVRDHTRGPRDFAPVTKECWVHGVFPSGRAFLLIDVDTGERLSRAMVIDEGGVMHDAQVESPPLLDTREDADNGYALDLTWDGGSARVEAEMVRNFAGGFGVPNEVLLGYDPEQTTHAFFEGWARFAWDGEIAYGLTERIIVNPNQLG
jgi:hypothetical protein